MAESMLAYGYEWLYEPLMLGQYPYVDRGWLSNRQRQTSFGPVGYGAGLGLGRCMMHSAHSLTQRKLKQRGTQRSYLEEGLYSSIAKVELTRNDRLPSLVVLDPTFPESWKGS